MSNDLILQNRHNNVLTVTINRPQKANSLTHRSKNQSEKNYDALPVRFPKIDFPFCTSLGS